jgi:DNA-binding NarL/FixJ family response regulator
VKARGIGGSANSEQRSDNNILSHMTVKEDAQRSDTPTIRLMLVDDHAVMRAGLANLLGLEPGFSVVAQADDGESALALWRQHRPDVVLLDVSLTGIDGIETLRRLKEAFPEARVLMLSSSEAQEDIRHAIKAGAAGYVTKNIRRAELVAAIRSVHTGSGAVSVAVSQRLAADAERGELSRREVEVLGLVRQGFTNDEIGKLLGISERTARAHVAAIMEKLDAADRAAAVARGFESGILKA